MSLPHDWKERNAPNTAAWTPKEDMAPHQVRVVEEHDALDAKLENLHVFIEDSPTFKSLGGVDRRLLIDQRHAMTVYRDILRQRIERFKQ